MHRCEIVHACVHDCPSVRPSVRPSIHPSIHPSLPPSHPPSVRVRARTRIAKGGPRVLARSLPRSLVGASSRWPRPCDTFAAVTSFVGREIHVATHRPPGPAHTRACCRGPGARRRRVKSLAVCPRGSTTISLYPFASASRASRVPLSLCLCLAFAISLFPSPVPRLGSFVLNGESQKTNDCATTSDCLSFTRFTRASVLPESADPGDADRRQQTHASAIRAG